MHKAIKEFRRDCMPAKLDSAKGSMLKWNPFCMIKQLINCILYKKK